MTTKVEKAKRMELRRKAGNRTVSPTPAIEKRPAYRLAYACFRCRVSFKLTPREEESRCPNCAETLNEMGRGFKAPRKSQTEQWKKVEKLWQAGFRFPSSTTRTEPYPEKLRDVERFVAENSRHPLRLRAFWPED